MKKQEKSVRNFGGKTSNFTSREEANYEKAHLKAYLKGKEFFHFGYGYQGNVKVHMLRKVNQIFF